MAALATRQSPGGAAAAAIRPLPLPSGIALCPPRGGPGMAVRKRPTPSSVSLCVPRSSSPRPSPYTPWTADFAHRDRTSSDLSRPTLQPAAPARDCPADRPSTPQWSFPLSPGAVDQARPRPVLAYQTNTGAVQSPSPKPTVTPPLPSRGCPE
uniref:proline-rich protein 36-like n=1 Tax=Agelaius phoeniceus TaxID=39638 RepID=UPI0023EE195F|nr:proline-rich protein 36-like [Agelaius phoeniceus]